jgi:hypothetical protein
LRDRGCRFFAVSDIDVADPPGPAKKYSFTGFPSSQQAVRSFRDQRIKLEAVEYCVQAVSTVGLSAAGWIPALHIGGLFERGSMMVEPGKRMTAPEPLGISGGCVWTHGIAGYRLVGIGIEWDAKNNMLIGVRIGALVPQLKAALGKNAVDLPESPYFKITLE